MKFLLAVLALLCSLSVFAKNVSFNYEMNFKEGNVKLDSTKSLSLEANDNWIVAHSDKSGVVFLTKIKTADASKSKS